MSDSKAPSPFAKSFFWGSFSAAREAILLKPGIYTAVSEAPIPSRRGFGILIVLLVVVALAKLLGAILDLATLPRLESFQDSLYQAITNLTIYQELLTTNPNFESLFGTIYNLFWFVVDLFGRYPSPIGVGLSTITFFTSNIFAWLTYGFIGFYVARAFGADVKKMGDYLGLMGLAFAPVLFYVLELVPGLNVPTQLVTFWILIAVYQAVRVTYDTSWWRTVLIVLLPFPINSILIAVVIQLGVGIGVAVSQAILAS